MDASVLPLMDMPMTRDQAQAILDLWTRLESMQRLPAFQRERQKWVDAKAKARNGLLGAKDAADVERRKLAQMVAGFPDDILTLFGSVALVAARSIETLPPPLPHPERVRGGDEAKRMGGEATEAAELVLSQGWKTLSFMLWAMAAAFALVLPHCKDGDAPFYIAARTQIVQLFSDLQTAIDRGVDAAAWLRREAEEAEEAD